MARPAPGRSPRRGGSYPVAERKPPAAAPSLFDEEGAAAAVMRRPRRKKKKASAKRAPPRKRRRAAATEPLRFEEKPEARASRGDGKPPPTPLRTRVTAEELGERQREISV